MIDPALAYSSIEQWKYTLSFPGMMETRPLPRSYRSIWRVLHVDGFEVRHRLTFVFGRNAFLLGNFDGEQIRS